MSIFKTNFQTEEVCDYLQVAFLPWPFDLQLNKLTVRIYINQQQQQQQTTKRQSNSTTKPKAKSQKPKAKSQKPKANSQ